MFPKFQLLLLFLLSTAVNSPSAEVLDIHDVAVFADSISGVVWQY